jgi:hypothetical protein
MSADFLQSDILEICELPEGVRFELLHDSPRHSIRYYGPGGDGTTFGNYSEPVKVKTWHALIEVSGECGECHELRGRAWCKGNGFSAGEAIEEAVKNYRAYRAGVEPSHV